MGSNILIITGPTASGKTALALEAAQAQPSLIINADSLQLYRDLPLLTAQPSAAEQAETPHALFGVLGPEARVSAVWWCREAMGAIAAAHAQGRRAIVVGGTGLYLKILQEGIAPVPDIPAETLKAAEAAVASDPAGLWAQLNAVDQQEGARLQPLNPARLARAWAVFQGTGRTLTAFQQDPPERFLTTPAEVQVVDLPRPELRARIAQRFEKMLEAGAIEEVAGLMAHRISQDAPIWRALGAREIRDFLDGRIPRAHMIQRAIERSCQYAKRQVTWIRHQVQ